ncbi:hypothetical protein [Streptococcus cuniculi]|uniref:Lipoprotein n=1 Tax=Streptococcus cuniculi TaxID=1432788 RepID=A0A4Y9JE07_9STRE|nr:hypothetical protein [Streptococcus cuniculi]MBF0777964.1 hypothetical protein [Streptococcus cuniculi]TFU98256.1 hypothetical protein E4T82_04440 [Streptococcus cuniculi]
MKKKLFPILVGLLTVTALTACSTNKATESDSSSSSMTAESSKVEESTSTSSSSEAKTLKESTIVYLSDQEIDAIQTLGDVKTAFKSLSDAYVADFDELIAQLPESGKNALVPFREQLTQMMDKQQETIATQFASLGDDSTQIPAEGRESMTTALKTARDQLKQAMATAREQAQSMLK